MYKSILVPVDLSYPNASRRAIGTAVELAKLWQAELHVLAVLPDFGMPVVGSFFPEGFEQNALQEMKQKLADFTNTHTAGDLSAHAHVAHGTIYEEILRASETLKADLVVISAHRPDLKDYLLGPNAARVARHANCSVMVVRGEEN